MKFTQTEISKHWVIVDWTGKLMDFGRFESFEEGEEFLCIKLGDNYETERQEYYVEEEKTNETR